MLAGLLNSVSRVSSDRILVVFDNNIVTRNSEEAQLKILTKLSQPILNLIQTQCWSNMVLAVGR